MRAALNALGFKDVEIVVAETGWPYKGDSNEVGPSLENAKAFNGNLIAHLRSMVGTPLMPGKSVDTYLFALYDEDLKPGPSSERAFGLFNPDLSMVYDVGLSKSSSQVRLRLVCYMELLARCCSFSVQSKVCIYLLLLFFKGSGGGFAEGSCEFTAKNAGESVAEAPEWYVVCAQGGSVGCSAAGESRLCLWARG